MKRFHFLILAFLIALLPLAGCAVHRFELIEPAEHARMLDEPVEFDIPPLCYAAVPHGDRLLLRIDNITHEPVVLLGERSYIVDPVGQSHAMRGGTIAPGSYITMILPPQPTVVHAGPRVGVGVGVGTGHRWGGVGVGVSRYHDPWHTPHRYYAYSPDAAYWRWTTGTVHLRLIYDIAGERIEHALTFARVRVQ